MICIDWSILKKRKTFQTSRLKLRGLISQKKKNTSYISVTAHNKLPVKIKWICSVTNKQTNKENLSRDIVWISKERDHDECIQDFVGFTNLQFWDLKRRTGWNFQRIRDDPCLASARATARHTRDLLNFSRASNALADVFTSVGERRKGVEGCSSRLVRSHRGKEDWYQNWNDCNLEVASNSLGE